MTSNNKFGLLRNILRALGLSQDAADDIVNWIVDLLAGDSKSLPDEPAVRLPYQRRDHFLSAAELNFYEVLKSVVRERAVIQAKVGLGDIFVVKTDDQSRFRIYTNKIDRKHVDFLLCDPKTMHPMVGVELDDRSHQRADRQARDAFVDEVYRSAGLPLVHITAKRSYQASELDAQLTPYLGTGVYPTAPAVRQVGQIPTPLASKVTGNEAPRCPKCGSPMLLRTTKNGANAGNQFWGCSNYPNCRTMLPYS